MPQIDFDAIAEISEPIEFKIDGETYRVVDVSDDMMKALNKYGEAAEEDITVISKGLALLTDQEESVFAAMDFRKKNAAFKFVMEWLTKQQDGRGEAKNSDE